MSRWTEGDVMIYRVGRSLQQLIEAGAEVAICCKELAFDPKGRGAARCVPPM